MHVLFVVCHLLSVLASEVYHPFGGQSVVWDQRGYCCLLFLTPLIFLIQKIAVMHWSEPKSSNRLFELLHSLDFGFRASNPDKGTSFAKAGCLQRLSSLSASCPMCRT